MPEQILARRPESEQTDRRRPSGTAGSPRKFPGGNFGKENFVVLAIFLLTSVGFGATTVIRQDESYAQLENHTAAPFPAIKLDLSTIESFPHGFETWFSDRFACKPTLVSARNFILLKAFQTSGSLMVMIGKNDFFYYQGDYENFLVRNDLGFSEQGLAAWKKLLEARTAWCAEHGMDYYYVIAPSKATIYPENIPKQFFKAAPKSRREQLLDYLKSTHARVNVIDLAPGVLAHKNEGIRYYRLDTHWNQLGAYDAYTWLLSHLKEKHPELGKAVSAPQLYKVPITFWNGDMARMLGLLGLLSEPNFAYGWRTPAPYTWTDYRVPYRNVMKREGTQPRPTIVADQSLPTAIMFHDSFTCFLRMFLSCNFSKIGYFWQPDFERSILLKERPKIVLQEQVENNLYKDIPKE